MPLTQLKRAFIFSAATFTGGYYIIPWSKNVRTSSCQQLDENSNNEISSYIYLPEDNDIVFDKSVDSIWHFWRKSNLPPYWKLLMLCKSKDYKIRHKAIESLSKLSDLEKWEYIAVAQASDINIAVGLARSFNPSSYFFLPPPFKDLGMDNVQNELYAMISSLQISNTNVCIQNLKRQVMKSANTLLKSGYNVNLEVGDPSVIYHSQQKKKAVFLYDKTCLETLLACSTQKCHRDLMIKEQVLKLLFKVLNYHKDDVKIHSLIAQIISNLAIDKSARNHIYMTGWIGILSEWKKSPHISINLPATKALANLDTDDVPHPLYDDGIYVLSPTCRLSQVDLSADVIFIHGLLGATFWTWRQCDTQNKTKNNPAVDSAQMESVENANQYSMCWPKDWLSADIPSLRLISVDYKTLVSNWKSNCPQEKENLSPMMSCG